MTVSRSGHRLGHLDAPFEPLDTLQIHKALPRQWSQPDRPQVPRSTSAVNLPSVSSFDRFRSLSLPAVAHQSPAMAFDLDLPPTPPQQSRYPALLPSPMPVNAASQTTPRRSTKRSFATPSDQRSPPTPDVTPPGPALHSPAFSSASKEHTSLRFSLNNVHGRALYTIPRSDSLSLDEASEPASDFSAASPPSLTSWTGIEYSTSHGEPIPHDDRDTTSFSRGRPQSPTPLTSSVARSKPYWREDNMSATPRLSTSSPRAVVQVIVVDTPPQRQKTLRHVSKQTALRQPKLQSRSDLGAEPTLAIVAKPPPSALQLPKRGRRRDTIASPPTAGSESRVDGSNAASLRARTEVWERGGIPVIVVPDRRSSNKAASRKKEPSLRSTSSRRSKRTGSLGTSGPHDEPPMIHSPPGLESRDRVPPELPPSSDSSRRRGRSKPHPSSTLGAVENLGLVPLPRGSESNRFEVSGTGVGLSTPPATSRGAPEHSRVHPSLQAAIEETPARKGNRNTPFSVASIETAGTAPEVSEALVVQFQHHQNSSVLVVDASARQSEASEATPQDESQSRSAKSPVPPKIMTTNPGGDDSLCPARARRSMDEMDSPLRNPRPPPQPPIHVPDIDVTPATPSGTTPAEEKPSPLGNHPEEAREEDPRRRPTRIVEWARSRRRHSVSHPPSASRASTFLARTFSLARDVNGGPETAAIEGTEVGSDQARTQKGEKPADVSKLHPHWRPQRRQEESCPCDDSNCIWARGSGDDEGRSPVPMARRGLHMSKRRLGARMRQTFAIFPQASEVWPPVDDEVEPERRTIQRTASGSLRVMQRRASSESMVQASGQPSEDWFPSYGGSRRRFWRGRRLPRLASRRRLLLLPIRDGLEGIPSLPQVLSERRREKRMRELRQKISGPKDVRDGVGEVVRGKDDQQAQRFGMAHF